MRFLYSTFLFFGIFANNVCKGQIVNIGILLKNSQRAGMLDSLSMHVLNNYWLSKDKSTECAPSIWNCKGCLSFFTPHRYLISMERVGENPYYFKPTVISIKNVDGLPIKDLIISATSTDSVIGSTEKYILRLGIDTSNKSKYSIIPFASYGLKYNDSLVYDKNYFFKKTGHINLEQVKELCKFNRLIADLFNQNVVKFKYYSFKDLEEYLNHIGLIFHPILLRESIGGLVEANSIMAAGNTESYKHELFHLYQDRIIGKYPTSRLAIEGVATWLGGSSGLDTSSIRKILLASDLKSNIEKLLYNMKDDFKISGKVYSLYAFGYIITQYLFSRGGIVEVKNFLRISEADILDYLSKKFFCSKSELSYNIYSII